MSAFQNLASPAPQVEEAVVVASSKYDDSEPSLSVLPPIQVAVEPARPSESVHAEPAREVDPAVTFDNPRQFAPPRLSVEKAYHLSAAALRAADGGADFESKAAVIKGKAERGFLRRALPWIYDQGDFISFGEVARFLFVKGHCIFIYGQASDPSPLYAIQLESVIAVQENPKFPEKTSFTISPQINSNDARKNLVTVLLKDRLTREQVFQITFDTSNDKSLAKRFLDVLQVNAANFGVAQDTEPKVVHSKDKVSK